MPKIFKTTFGLKDGYFYCAYKDIQNIQTLHGYIFIIFQHFVTKHCMFTSFHARFVAVVLDCGLSARMEMSLMAGILHKGI